MTTVARIGQSLAVLDPLQLEIGDESAAHAGHAGAKDGGHYRIFVVSPQFSGKSATARHRMVYAALAGMMRSREIHALAVRALAPGEI